MSPVQADSWVLHTLLQPTRDELLAATDVSKLLGDMMIEACRKIQREHPGAELIGYTRHDRRSGVCVYLRYRIPKEKSWTKKREKPVRK